MSAPEKKEIIALLQSLIAIPSFSKEEDKTRQLICDYLERYCDHVQVKGNNVWVKNKYFQEGKPTILLNSHHDTVRPNQAYTRDPFKGEIADGRLLVWAAMMLEVVW